MGWESGTRNDLVFTRPDASGAVQMDHTLAKHSPITSFQDRLVAAEKKRMKQAATGLRHIPHGAALRYPEVRGLRFVNELGKYHDRDRSAALSIARLHCLTVLGRPRPQPFSRSVRRSDQLYGFKAM